MMLARVLTSSLRSRVSKVKPCVNKLNRKYVWNPKKIDNLFKFSIRAYSAEHHPLTPEDIEERVLNALKQFSKIDPAAVNAKAHFQKDLGLDSLETIDVIMLIEDEFSIEIPDAEMEKLQTCEDVINYLVAHPHAK